MKRVLKLAVWPVVVLALAALCFSSCTRVKVSESYKGVVVDSESGAPLANVAILVRVMRVSSYDGTSQYLKFNYTSNQRGEFTLPARKKIVDSVTERMEEMRYYEMITFGKPGYSIEEFRSDEDQGPFALSNAHDAPMTIRLKKAAPNSTR